VAASARVADDRDCVRTDGEPPASDEERGEVRKMLRGPSEKIGGGNEMQAGADLHGNCPDIPGMRVLYCKTLLRPEEVAALLRINQRRV
jgi:hypothetical protein